MCGVAEDNLVAATFSRAHYQLKLWILLRFCFSECAENRMNPASAKHSVFQKIFCLCLFRIFHQWQSRYGGRRGKAELHSRVSRCAHGSSSGGCSVPTVIQIRPVGNWLFVPLIPSKRMASAQILYGFGKGIRHINPVSRFDLPDFLRLRIIIEAQLLYDFCMTFAQLLLDICTTFVSRSFKLWPIWPQINAILGASIYGIEKHPAYFIWFSAALRLNCQETDQCVFSGLCQSEAYRSRTHHRYQPRFSIRLHRLKSSETVLTSCEA